MAASASQTSSSRLITLNLLVPGVGLVLGGPVWLGVAIGLLFAALANAVIWATLIVPADVAPWVRGLLVGLAGGTYLGAQVRVAQTLRDVRAARTRQRRDEALSHVRARLAADDVEGAWAALRPVDDLAHEDLLVAYRFAQVLTRRRDAGAARAAWQQVRRLDLHNFYRDEVRAQLKAGAPPAEPGRRIHGRGG